MKPAAHEILGIAERRGFWLRCFLSGAMVILGEMGPAAVISYGQCVDRVIRVSRVQGGVLDSYGRPIPNVVIELKSEDKIVATTTGNETGSFSIPAPPGKYELAANARGFETGFASLEVGTDLVRAFKPARLFVILDVGMATLDQCTFSTTSRREFDKVIRENTRKH